MAKILIGIVAFVALVGGTVVVANQSLPGSPLYGLKVNVNERVVAALYGRGEGRGLWHVGAINDRLGEALTLAERGKLDAQAATALTENFDFHVGIVSNVISELENTDKNREAATNVATELARVLSEKAGTIASIRVGVDAESETAASLATLTSKINTTLTAAVLVVTRDLAEFETPSGVKIEGGVEVEGSN